MKKKALTALAAAAVLLLVGLTACGSKTSQKIVSEALGPDVSGGSEISASDTHKEFHGDGTNCIVLTFQDDAVLEQIKEREDWQPLPMDQTTRILVYGISGVTGQTSYQIGPYLSDGSGSPKTAPTGRTFCTGAPSTLPLGFTTPTRTPFTSASWTSEEGPSHETQGIQTGESSD